jgi:8-oxo-dGTP diphosphatase
MKTVDTVAFILIRDGKVLVERRRLDRVNDPGAVVIPGGHVDPGETHLQALRRELLEELGVEGNRFSFFDRMLCHSDTEDQNNHWYICNEWSGTPVPTEAEEVFFIGEDELDKLSLANDRQVISRLFTDFIHEK